MRPGPITALSLLLLAAPGASEDRPSWDGYRGPDGQGRSLEPGLFPAAPASLRVAWKRPLGSGYSGVAVAGERLVTLEAADGLDRMVALDPRSGATLWTRPLGPTLPGRDGSHDGPLSTPALGADVAVGLGPRGDLVAVEAASGRVLWRTHLVEDLGARAPHYGFATSPRILGDRVIVAVGGWQKAVLALRLADGGQLWAAGSDLFDYQSPILRSTAAGKELIVAGNSTILGISPDDGRVIWQLEHGGGGTRGAASLSPVPTGELGLFLARRDDASVLVEVDPKTGESVEAWESRAIRNSYAVALADGDVLLGFSSRFLTAVEVATGLPLWRTRAVPDGFPVLADGRLVVQTKDGSLVVGRADRDGWSEEARLALFPEGSWTAPAIADGAVFARGFAGIARVEAAAGGIDTGPSATEPTARAAGFWSPLEAELRDRPEAADELVRRFAAGHGPFPAIRDGQAHFLWIGAAADVALVGDLAGVRSELALRRLAPADAWALSVPIEPDAEFSYAYWVDFRLTTDPLAPEQRTHTMFGPDLEPVAGGELEMSWHGPADERAASPRPAAHGTTLLEIPSSVLGRRIRVALRRSSPPASLGTGEILYVLAGEEALAHGNLLATLERESGRTVRPVDVAFVLEPVTGALDSWSRAFLTEVAPEVEARLGRGGADVRRTVTASGWAGLAALHAALHHPGEIDRLALQSVTALTHPWGGAVAWIRASRAPLPEVWLDWGTYDLRAPHESWSVVEDNRRIFAALQARGAILHGGEVPAGSGWASWNRRTGDWLKALLPAN